MALQIEHQTQCLCVRGFANEYPELWEAQALYAIPNGGYRNKATAARMKAEGVVAGVADMFLSVARAGFYGLYIELKTDDGAQSPAQKKFQKNAEARGYKYIIVRDVDQFLDEVAAYLDAPATDIAILTGQTDKKCKPVIVPPKRRREPTLDELINNGKL